MTRRFATNIALLAAVLGSSACSNTAAKSGNTARETTENRPGFGVVLVDLSASFAPLTQTDRAALNESAATLADLAVKDWPPPVTIVWKRIGTNSAASKLLCGPFDFNRHLVSRTGDSSEDPEKFRSNLKLCAETVVRSSHVPDKQLEQYTDLAGAIATASQDWADEQGNKALLIFSDFLGDYKKGSGIADLRLHGERVVMLHRLGNMDTSDVTAYLERISSIRESLLHGGAKSVVLLPTFRATKATLARALSPDMGSTGVTVSILNDLRPTSDDDSLKRAINAMSAALARKALEWPSPVIVTWFDTGVDGRHTQYSVPIQFTPHLVQRETDSPSDMSNPDDFRTGIKELGNVMVNRADGNGDVLGALKLISESDNERVKLRVIVVMSDLSHGPAPNTPPLNLKGNRVVLLYRPSVDSATFQKNLVEWKSYLGHSESSQVCALNVSNITPSQQFCLSDQETAR